MRHKESNLQIACVRWFRYEYPHLAKMLFAVPNGGARNAITGAILKAEGVVAGVADLILLCPSVNGKYHSLCIEMKTTSKASKQRETQKEWQNVAELNGNKYVICRNFEEFRNAVICHLSA